MSTVQEIESAILKLAPTQLSELSKWFEEHVERDWDYRMKKDVEAGKFERFKKEISNLTHQAPQTSPIKKILQPLWISCFYLAAASGLVTIVLLAVPGKLGAVGPLAQFPFICAIIGTVVLVIDKILRLKS